MRVVLLVGAMAFASQAAVADSRVEGRVCNNGVYVPSQSAVTPNSDANRNSAGSLSGSATPYAQRGLNPNFPSSQRGTSRPGGDYDPCAAVGSTSRTYDKGR